MRKVKLDPEKNPIGTKHYMRVGPPVNIPYHVVTVWGADTFAPIVDPMVVAEARMKGLELENPFITLPLSVFAEVFQYSDEAFWIPVKQYQPEPVTEGGAEIVAEA